MYSLVIYSPTIFDFHSEYPYSLYIQIFTQQKNIYSHIIYNVILDAKCVLLARQHTQNNRSDLCLVTKIVGLHTPQLATTRFSC